MAQIEWLKKKDRRTQSGLDRGVLYPRTAPAVPWNGLVSVNESENQSSSKYYIDGRLTLTAVTPSEYTATISAYTFPDEFADICGITEAAPGLFFDSQVPDQFGLSYRTFYSDGVSYKLHLLYGVTAAVSDVKYETLSDSQNDPTLFEFAISAIPQPVYGFRPATHIVIDTRHVSATDLATIEGQIYGTDTQDAALPSAQSLYEMLNYGDMVIIRDNEDGTWTAEGAGTNISVDANGDFVITNVTVRDNGDGTYEIASTHEPIV